jgi:quinoprotein glucose dehydrogenase
MCRCFEVPAVPHPRRALAVLAVAAIAGCNGPDGEVAVPPLVEPEIALNPGNEASTAADWPNYNRDLAGTRFSPLTQVNRDNVAELRVAWTYALGRNPTSGGLSGGSEVTPIVVAGRMYLTAADRVVALQPETGIEIWRHELDDGASPSRRGVTYWDGDATTGARIFVTVGRRLLALDADNGRRSRGFGTGGEIEMAAAYDAAPTRFDDLLIVGSNSAPGSVRAYDARTGAEVWAFTSVPGPGEAGHETWQSEAWREQPNLLHWAFAMTIDPERELLYAVFESPGPDDYYGGNRPGDTLYGDSIVALDVRTGERKWHFQTVHHDIWDYDLPAPPGLLDVEIDGVVVPLLAQAGKTGYLYLLNRVTGEPVFGIEETPVPQSDVPGEATSPTQPIPVKPGPIARVRYAPEDLVTAADTTAAHAEFCAALVERGGGLENAGPFTPWRYRAPESPPRTTVVFPGSVGGANWGGTASDPELGYVFVNTMSEGSLGWIEANPAASVAPPDAAEGAVGTSVALPFRRRSAVGGPLARFWSNDAAADSGGNEPGGSRLAWPCQKPPWGELVAVDAATGEIAWRVPLGITPELPTERQRTGRLNMGGPVATAGGLVFIGATNDRRFRAFDSVTGEELWSTELRMSAHAVPMTYLGRDGNQYVAIAAAGAAAIDDPDAPDAQALVVFAPPLEAP